MGIRKYYVRYSTYKYEGETNDVFDNLAQVVELLTRHAANPDFQFEVIHGEKVEFEPVDIIKSYRPKGHS